MAEHAICAAEGGPNCRFEDFRRQRNGENALEGLHSSWVGPHWLAMQRPSERLIDKYRLLDAFQTYAPYLRPCLTCFHLQSARSRAPHTAG